MTETENDPTLVYHDGRAVHVGDRVRIRRLLRRPIEATINYLTGETPPHRDLEVEGLVTLAVEYPKGTVVSWERLPGSKLERRFELLSRGQAENVVDPSEELS